MLLLFINVLFLVRQGMKVNSEQLYFRQGMKVNSEQLYFKAET